MLFSLVLVSKSQVFPNFEKYPLRVNFFKLTKKGAKYIHISDVSE